MNDPMAIAELQRAARENSRDAYKKFSAANTALSRRVHLRGLLKFKTAGVLLSCTDGRPAFYIPCLMLHRALHSAVVAACP